MKGKAHRKQSLHEKTAQMHLNNSIRFIYHAHYFCILFSIHEHVIDMVKNICSVKALFCGLKHHALSDDIGKEFSVCNVLANVPKTKRQMAKTIILHITFLSLITPK